MSLIKSRSRRKQGNALNPQNTDGVSPKTQNTSFDPFRDFDGPAIELYLSKFFYYIRSNFRSFILIFLFSLISFLSIVGYILWNENRQTQSLITFQKMMKDPVMNLESGSPKIALEKLDKYIQKNNFLSARIRAQMQKILYLEKIERFRDSIDLNIKLAEEIDIKELQTYFLIRAAIHAENLNLFAKAESIYKKAISKMPEQNEFKAFALFGQGRMLYNLDKYQEARETFNKILSFEDSKTKDFLAPIAVYLLELPK